MPYPSCGMISGAVEGDVDEAVIRRLVREAGGVISTVYGRKGKPFLKQKLVAYNQAARFGPWIVLVDLNQEADCAPDLRRLWLPNAAAYMCFRIAVRSIEAWLLADRENIAQFLSVAVSCVPQDPEKIDDPKTAMVNLARRSRRQDIREDMAPRPESGRRVGPAYSSRLTEFVQDTARGWRPKVAINLSESLSRCLQSLERLKLGP